MALFLTFSWEGWSGTCSLPKTEWSKLQILDVSTEDVWMVVCSGIGSAPAVTCTYLSRGKGNWEKAPGSGGPKFSRDQPKPRERTCFLLPGGSVVYVAYQPTQQADHQQWAAQICEEDHCAQLRGWKKSDKIQPCQGKGGRIPGTRQHSKLREKMKLQIGLHPPNSCNLSLKVASSRRTGKTSRFKYHAVYVSKLTK